jgi:hypothetical protein
MSRNCYLLCSLAAGTSSKMLNHSANVLLLLLLLLSCCSAKALSKYTDMVDSISREQLTKLADATDAARITLKQVRACSCVRLRNKWKQLLDVADVIMQCLLLCWCCCC